MIIIPKENPVIENLNSYYIDIRKLLEHCQGKTGSGGIHFISPTSECVIFFDKDRIMNTIIQNKNGDIEENVSIDRIINESENKNFKVNVYEIDNEKINFLANLSSAEDLYKDLSTDFTDLEGLIKNMNSENLTGYIHISINKNKENGLIFFNMGEILGGSYSWEKGELNHSKEGMEILKKKLKESGGVFNVRKFSSKKKEPPKTVKTTAKQSPANVLVMLEELMNIFENIFKDNKKIKSEFNKSLKMKFMEKADKYPFLDPFAAEFEYVNQKISYTGDTEEEELIKGIIESLRELADELDIMDQFYEYLAPWIEKYSKKIKEFRVEL